MFQTMLALAAVLAVPPSDHVILGSWNIENLSKSSSQPVPALVEHWRLSGVDVLALQEIHDTDGVDGTYRNEKLDGVVRMLNERPGHTWEYRLFPKRGDYQLTGVAWNRERVELVGEPWKLPVKDPDPSDSYHVWDRPPYAVKFRAGEGLTDFVLVPLHMKSNVDGYSFGRRQRWQEAKALAAVSEELVDHFEDEDVVLLGDTNCKVAAEDALDEFRSLDLVDLNATDAPTYVTGSPFDRIFVPMQEEFRFSRQYVLVSADPEMHEAALSDHYLVKTALRVTSDDDP